MVGLQLPLAFSIKTESALEMQYRLSYVEEDVRTSSRSWVIRQMGVYHHYNPNSDCSLWILINPKPNSLLQRRLEAATIRWQRATASQGSWHLTHLLVLSSYFNNWRWYLRNLGADIEHIVSRGKY